MRYEECVIRNLPWVERYQCVHLALWDHCKVVIVNVMLLCIMIGNTWALYVSASIVVCCMTSNVDWRTKG